MNRKHFAVCTGSAAAIILMGAAFFVSERLIYWYREQALIDILDMPCLSWSEGSKLPYEQRAIWRQEHYALREKRTKAAQGLGEMRSVRAVPKLLGLRAPHIDESAVWEAIVKIGKRTAPHLRKLIEPGITDRDDFDRRQMAHRVLGLMDGSP